MAARVFTALVAIAVSATLFCGCPPAQGKTVYFLVSERNPAHGDSYILPLSDPAAIAHARALIADPDGTDAPIAVADIEVPAKCDDYVNRDLLNGGAPWSWRVSKFRGFADFTVEIYDGWPTYVEEHLDSWFGTTGGAIGFWSYTVTRELTPDEVSSGQLAE